MDASVGYGGLIAILLRRCRRDWAVPQSLVERVLLPQSGS